MMKKILFTATVIVYLLGCTKSPVEEEKSLIDFISSSQNYFSPAYINSHKNSASCSELKPYWEGKKIRLQGYILQANVDTVSKSFWIYETYDVRTPYYCTVYYDMKDSSILSKMLVDNKDKHCLLTATCRTYPCTDGLKKKSLDFVITRLEDFEFR